MQTRLEAEKYNSTVLDLIQNSHYRQAIPLCKRILALSKPSDKSSLATQYFNWGYCCYRQGKYQEAISKYSRVITISPESCEAYNAWGTCLSYLGKYEEAIEKYKEAIRLRPLFPFSYMNWILALLLQNKEEEALKFAKEKFERTSYRTLDLCKVRYRSEILAIEDRLPNVENPNEMKLLMDRFERVKLLLRFIDKVRLVGYSNDWDQDQDQGQG